MKKITADCFWREFLHVWDSYLQADVDGALLEKFSSNVAWTQFVLSRDGLMDRIRKRFSHLVQNLSYQLEWSKVDALFVGGKNLCERLGNYPSEVHVLIENENNDDLETEMWKLLHWRCPLKVLVFYDWSEHEIASHPVKAKWAEGRIQKLKEMRQEVNQFWPESPETEYLMIIGQRTRVGAISWRHEIITSAS